MNSKRRLGEELFSEHFHRIERIIRTVAARNRLSPDEGHELYSLVMMKLIEDEYAILRDFQGKSRLGTYLMVIIQRVLLDVRTKEWGRWRPCARARRLGATAVRLDRRINRDGQEPMAAIQQLVALGVDETVTELEKLTDRIPRRIRRRLVAGDAQLESLADPAAADHRAVSAERRGITARLQTALVAALQDLPEQERNLLRLRFADGWTVRRIAAKKNLAERPLYRHFERILRQLRHRLERIGLGWSEISAALEGRETDLNLDLS